MAIADLEICRRSQMALPTAINRAHLHNIGPGFRAVTACIHRKRPAHCAGYTRHKGRITTQVGRKARHLGARHTRFGVDHLTQPRKRLHA